MNVKSGSILVFALWGTLAAVAGAQPVTINLVPIGNPGNVADPLTGYGSVPYVYDMGEYDVTLSQYTAFLNAVAASGDPYGLYNPAMAPRPIGSFDTFGIVQTGLSGNYSYSVTGSYGQAANCPIYDVSWGDAARFVNWLENGEPAGAEGPGTTETGTYSLNGGTSNAALMAVTRNAGSDWVLPTRNEWYKAAYYQGGSTDAGYWLYPTQSDEAPSNLLSSTGTNNANFTDAETGLSNPPYGLTVVGAFAASPGPFGTFDQGGDVAQWVETESGTVRGICGASFADISGDLMSTTNGSGGTDPAYAGIDLGFRVAYVPEPGCLSLLFAGGIAFLIFRLSPRLRKGAKHVAQFSRFFRQAH